MEEVEAFRKKAETPMLAHARCAPVNETKTIRQDAVSDCIVRSASGLSFSRFVIANLVAIGLAGVLALTAISGKPPLLDALRDVLAQIIARFFAGS